MLCIFFGIGKTTTLGKATCLFCVKDIGSQINDTATSQSSSRCPNYKRKKEKKNPNKKTRPLEIKCYSSFQQNINNGLVTSSTQQNEFWLSKHQSIMLKHSMTINSVLWQHKIGLENKRKAETRVTWHWQALGLLTFSLLGFYTNFPVRIDFSWIKHDWRDGFIFQMATCC